MPHINSIFSELLKLLPRHQFEKAVCAHSGDRYAKRFTTWNQFTTLLYAQISRKESLREIETGLAAHGERLYHLGLKTVHRSTLAASTIAAIYKARWQIELFFKWIKQNLKIKSFLGTSRNAVMTQVWVAMCSYLLLAYIKYQTKYAHSLLELSRVIREMLMERKSLIDILSLKPEKLRGGDCEPVQAVLF